MTDGALPPTDAVRIEELINYFSFDYPQPAGNEPFSITTELAACPWNAKHRLALIGIHGRQTPDKAPQARNLVFLVLPSTPGDRKEAIHQAVARLEAGGSAVGLYRRPA